MYVGANGLRSGSPAGVGTRAEAQGMVDEVPLVGSSLSILMVGEQVWLKGSFDETLVEPH